jgi:D-glycero-D-manno-heptose 1,7-bisphosphate phosphatase
MLHKAVFIDKDGTLIPDVPYNVNPEFIQLHEGVVEGLRLLQEQQYKTVIISNQSGVGRGYFPEEELDKVRSRIELLLGREHIKLDGFYYCPHYVGSLIEKYNVACECRKPKPGLLLQAAQDLGIDLSRSWMIGDILNDVEAGKRAGCKTVLIDNGGETEWIMNEYRVPDIRVHDVHQAAIEILKHEKELIDEK